jgi:hypothetical protein
MKRIIFEKEDKRKLLAYLFHDLPQVGVHTVSITQLLHHSGSFNGKDFKAMVQIGPLIFPKILRESTILWMSLSLVSSLVYHKNKTLSMDLYSGYMTEAIDMFISQLKHHFSSDELQKKVKLHLLTHFPSAYRLFGPLCMYSTEIIEEENGTVRSYICNSNHKNPSRDVAERFSTKDFATGIASGMYTEDIQTGTIFPIQLLKLTL